MWKKFFVITLLLICLLGLGQNYAKAKNAVCVVGNKGKYYLDASEVFMDTFEIDESKIDGFIFDISKRENVESYKAHFEYDTNFNCFVKIPSRQGYRLKTDKLRQDIISAITLGGGVINCEYDIIYPDIDADDLQVLPVKRSCFSTYHTANENRDNNIKLATQKLNGHRVKNGEVFSFNAVVGVRSQDNGYKPSKVILDGVFSEGLGGGVCQVSTTLYNAVLLSGLEIVECHQHSLKVGYVEPAFDAMVSFGNCDLKFKNNTGDDIFIVGRDQEQRITFEIYGKRQNNKYIRQSVVCEEFLPDRQFVKSKLLPAGESRTIVKGQKGCLAKGYILEYLDGELKSKKLIRQNSYKKVDEVIEFG